METRQARNIDEAIELHKWLRPKATQRSQRRFAGQAARHFNFNYQGAKGLRLVGLGECECVNTIIFDDFKDTELGTEISFSVTVLTENGPERFDNDEALGYNQFIQAAPYREELQAAIVKKHLEEKRSKRCED